MKKSNLLQLAALALLPGAALIVASCSTPSAGKETAAVIQTRDGVMVIDSYQLTATVSAIDAGSRRIALTTPDGQKRVFKAAPVVNLNQLRIGEKITATATEEIALFLSKPGTPDSTGNAATVSVAARDHESEVLTAQTWETTAKILALDPKTRRIALLFVNGSRSVVIAGPKVDLANLKVGDAVAAQMAEALVITVQK
jgi:hypothetical protein